MIISKDILQQFDVPGPRYTSYPTADRFVEAYGEAQYLHSLQERHSSARVAASPLSIYIHVPFCASLCYYCACNKIITGNYQKAIDYLGDLKREVELLLPHLGQGQSVSQIHLGGGTPTFFKDKELHALVNLLKAAFQWQPNGEYAIEVDPRTVDAERLHSLWSMGLNRLSLGIQDFDPEVQQAVHRVQTVDQVSHLMETARGIGFGSINLDLITAYHFKHQTVGSALCNLCCKCDRTVWRFTVTRICQRALNRSVTYRQKTFQAHHKKRTCCKWL
jgi:oxygen-independent coproporphyrinogen-3 oxidase